MKPNHNNEEWRWVVYFDSESNLVPKGGEVLVHEPKLICATFIDRSRGERHDNDYEGPTLCDDFYQDLSESVYAGTTVRVIAHNVGYDLQATGGIERLVKLGWRVDSLYEKGFTYILRLRREGHRQLLFLSSTQFWTAALAKIAPLFGLEKLVSIGHKAEDPEKLKEYCRQDVLIVERAMEWLQEFIKDNDLGSMGITLPSIAMKAFRHRFMSYPPIIHNYAPAMLLERAAYYGGRTEAFYIGKVPVKLYKLDVNSMYPAVMLSETHPVELKKVFTEVTLDQLVELMDRYFVVADVTIRVEKPCVPLKSGKLLFPVGEFNTVLTSYELENLDPSNVVSIRGVACYWRAPLFHDFVDFFYSERKKAIEKGETAREQMLKLIMNALYGKFGQRSTEWIRVGDAPEGEMKAEDLLLPDGHLIKLRTFGGSTWLNDGALMESFESFPAIAASVTSAARALLWRYMTKAGLENVYYCDTDSLFVNAEGLARLKDDIHQTELGKLKLLGESDNVVINGAKDYAWGDEVKHKGIPEDAERSIVDGEEKAKVWTWPKVATWLRERKLGHFENRAVYKKTSTVYTKATVPDGGGRVLPIRLPAGEGS